MDTVRDVVEEAGVSRMRITAEDLISLGIAARALGFRDGEWELEVTVRTGLATELKVVPRAE